MRETLSRAAGAYNELRERGRALADEVAAAELSRSELRASSARLEAELKRTTLENHSMQVYLFLLAVRVHINYSYISHLIAHRSSWKQRS